MTLLEELEILLEARQPYANGNAEKCYPNVTELIKQLRAAQQSEHTDPPLALVCDCESCKRVNFNLKSFAKSAAGSASR